MSVIGFVGPFGDSNFGDYAMAVNDILDIAADKSILFTYNEDFTEVLVKKYLNNLSVKVVPVVSLLQNQQQLTKSKTFQVNYQAVNEDIEDVISSVDSDNLQRDIEEIDKLVVTGGGFLNFLWCSAHRKKRLFQILSVILLATKNHKPVYFMGNTYGPWYDCGAFFGKIFNEINSLTNFAARDKISITYLKDIVNPINEVKFIPDDLYFVNQKFNKPVCNLNLPDKYVVLELYLSIEQLESQENNIKAFVDYFNLSDIEVVFLPFDVQYGGKIQGEWLKDHINNINIISIDRCLPFEVCNEVIKNAKFVFCNRYHALVMAVRNRVPCYMYARTIRDDKTYYINKINGILDLFDDKENNRDKDFFTLDLTEFFATCKIYKEISDFQLSVYGSDNKQEKIMYSTRQNYLKQILL